MTTDTNGRQQSLIAWPTSPRTYFATFADDHTYTPLTSDVVTITVH